MLTFNALLELVNSHLVLSVHLVKELLVVGMHVQLLLLTASHGRPQLAGQGLLARLQLTQQRWGDGDVVAPATYNIVGTTTNSNTMILG